jgi:hypothetical protein
MFLRQNLTPPPSISGEQTLDLVGLDQDPTKTVNLLKRRTPTPPPLEARERGPQTAAAMETPSDGRDVEGLFFVGIGVGTVRSCTRVNDFLGLFFLPEPNVDVNGPYDYMQVTGIANGQAFLPMTCPRAKIFAHTCACGQEMLPIPLPVGSDIRTRG